MNTTTTTTERMGRLVAGLVVIGALIVAGTSLFGGSAPRAEAEALAICLRDKGVTMYGAAWCSHCQNQKTMFGDAFDMVPYVECPENTALCTEKGIEGYPTWDMPDGTRLLGAQSFEVLAESSGCALQ